MQWVPRGSRWTRLHPRTRSRQELPFILFDEDLRAGFKLLHVVHFKNAHVSLDPIRVIDPFFLHQPSSEFILANQQWHARLPPLLAHLSTDTLESVLQ